MAEKHDLDQALVNAKHLALDIVNSVFERDARYAHCAACSWVKLAACMVLWDVDSQIERSNDAALTDSVEEDEQIARMESGQTEIYHGSALRLYAVADSAMRQRWDDKDGARAAAIGNDAYITRRPHWRSIESATMVDAECEANEIVSSVFGCDPVDPEDARLSIAVCAVLAGVDPQSDAAVATRVYALLGLVQDAWEWLLEGADLITAVDESGLLMAHGDLPEPRHTVWVVSALASREEANNAGWHQYTECGLDDVWLDGGVEYRDTPYGRGVAIKNAEGLDAAIADWIVERKRSWRGCELKFLRKRLDLSQGGLGDLLGYSAQQVRRWEHDMAEMPSPVSRLVRLLVREWETKSCVRAPVFIGMLHERMVEGVGIKASYSPAVGCSAPPASASSSA